MKSAIAIKPQFTTLESLQEDAEKVNESFLNLYALDDTICASVEYSDNVKVSLKSTQENTLEEWNGHKTQLTISESLQEDAEKVHTNFLNCDALNDTSCANVEYSDNSNFKNT